MTYDVALCHPDEITKFWSLSHPDDLAIPSISSGWLIVDAYVIRMTYLALVSHPDELRQIHYVIRMTYSSISCHPDDLTEFGFSSGWVTAMLYVIRMRYTSFLKSSGWDSKFRFSTTRGGPSALPYRSPGARLLLNSLFDVTETF